MTLTRRLSQAEPKPFQGFRVQDFKAFGLEEFCGLKAMGLEFTILGSGFKGFGCRVQGLGPWSSGSITSTTPYHGRSCHR